MASNKRRNHSAKPQFYGQPDGLQAGDSIGNRRSFKEMQVPADDIGNRTSLAGRLDLIRDDIGNSIESAPTHVLNSTSVGSDGRTRRRKEEGAHQPMRIGRYIMGGVNPIVTGANVYGQTPVAAPVPVYTPRQVSQDDEERVEYILTSDPEMKRVQAEEAVKKIMEKAGRVAEVLAVLSQDEERRYSVAVSINDKGLDERFTGENRADNADQPIFVIGSPETLALNFIVNKIVNRYPNDRIRLTVNPVLGAAA